MGYSTEFKGELKFIRELTSTELAAVKKMLWADCSDYPEWKHFKGHYIQFGFTDDFSGIKWDGSEKFYEAVGAVNTLIAEARKTISDFGLTVSLYAQGEDADDRWILTIKDGLAIRIDTPPGGQKITCPHCESNFYLEDSVARNGANSILFP